MGFCRINTLQLRSVFNFYGDNMSTDQNSETQPQEDSAPHKVTLQKDLFPTKLTVVERQNNPSELNEKLLELMNKMFEEGYSGELFDYEDPAVDELKEEVFSVCSHLVGFGFEESYPKIGRAHV